MIRHAPVLCFFAASALLGQDPYAARWSELRRRIAEGGDVSQLVRDWKAAEPPTVRSQVTPKRAREFRSSEPPPSRLDRGRDQVRVAACEAGVHPSLALAIVEHEAGFDNLAHGEKGEIGAGQIMPATAAAFGFDLERLATDYEYNVRAAVAILRYLLDHFGGDEEAAIRGYNGGIGWRGASPSTLNKIEGYAAAVTELRSKYVPITCG